jgi:shikimate 5-dehydrogenase
MTMLFIGVTTKLSAAHQLFPAWSTAIGITALSRLEGVDVPLGAPTPTYREIVRRLRDDPDVAGALITSHKVGTYAAALDLFDATDDLASLCAEIGCVSRATGRLVGHALDPLTSMAALDRLAPPNHWKAFPNARVACLGAGGAGVAIAVGLARRVGHVLGPAAIVVTDRTAGRVNHLLETLRRVGVPESWAAGTMTGGDASLTDKVVTALPPGSIVVNATGMGKDVPGSPVTEAVRFPEGGIAWDLNYRGDRPFLEQAVSQASVGGLTVADGWDYFAISWALHVARVFGANEDAATLDRAVAATVRS